METYMRRYINVVFDYVDFFDMLDRTNSEQLRRLISKSNEVLATLNQVKRVKFSVYSQDMYDLSMRYKNAQQKFSFYFDRVKNLIGDDKRSRENQRRIITKNKLHTAYKVLEISPNASDAEVKKRYKDLAKKYHPDKVAHTGNQEDIRDSEQIFTHIQNAWEEIKKERGIK